jgi:hypothetical protein
MKHSHVTAQSMCVSEAQHTARTPILSCRQYVTVYGGTSDEPVHREHNVCLASARLYNAKLQSNPLMFGAKHTQRSAEQLSHTPRSAPCSYTSLDSSARLHSVLNQLRGYDSSYVTFLPNSL